MRKQIIFLVLALCLVGYAAAQEVGITLNKETFLPGDTIKAMPHLYDFESRGYIELSILDSNNEIVFKKFMYNEETAEYNTENNAIAGKWIIKADYNNIEVKREVTMQRKESIDVSIIGNKMVIKNNGNIPYIKSTKIIFTNANGEKKAKVLNLDLSIGEEKEFALESKEGIYSVSIADMTFNSIQLTGKATAVIEINPDKKISQPIYPAFVIFGILIVVIIFLYYNLKERPFISKRGVMSGYVEIKKREMPAAPLQVGETAKTENITAVSSEKKTHPYLADILKRINK
ncbi:MAG: hypothetical protein V1660_02970 [archaeon]